MIAVAIVLLVPSVLVVLAVVGALGAIGWATFVAAVLAPFRGHRPTRSDAAAAREFRRAGGLR